MSLTPPEPAVVVKTEIGATEIVALATVSATVSAALYNIGAFSPVGIGLVSLLAIEDLFLGAGAALAVISALSLLVGVGMLIANSTSKMFKWLAGGVSIAAYLSIFIYTIFFAGWTKYLLVVAMIGFLFLALIYFAWSRIHSSHYLFIGATYMFALSFGAGAATSEGILASTNQAKDMVVTMKSDGSKVIGKLFRVTSSYIFLVVGNDLTTIPLEEVRDFTRREFR